MIEDTVLHAPHLTSVIKGGATPETLLEMVLGIIEFRVLSESPVKFECTCSQERAVTMIAALGKAEVESMLEHDKGAAMNCGFCSESYQLDENDLRKILADVG